jgi:thioredoxin
MEANQTELLTLVEFKRFITNNSGAVVYFSTPDCNVCKVLKPKLKELLAEKFPEMKFAYVNCETAKELAAQQSIFSVPTILFFIDGKEFFRKSRNVNLNELSMELERPYSLFFE